MTPVRSGKSPLHQAQRQAPAAKDRLFLTVVVPVLNEQDAIDTILRRVVPAPCARQILVVDPPAIRPLQTVNQRQVRF